jgi:hypothetical protein
LCESARAHWAGVYEYCANAGHTGFEWRQRDNPAARKILKLFIVKRSIFSRFVIPMSDLRSLINPFIPLELNSAAGISIFRRQFLHDSLWSPFITFDNLAGKTSCPNGLVSVRLQSRAEMFWARIQFDWIGCRPKGAQGPCLKR